MDGVIGLAGTMARRSDYIDAHRREIALAPTLFRGPWTFMTQLSLAELEEWERRSAKRAEFSIRHDFTFGSVTLGGKRVAFTDSQTVTRDTIYNVLGYEYKSSYREFSRGQRSYSNAVLELELFLSRASFGASFGARDAGVRGAARAWGSVDALLPLREGLSVHIGAGRTSGIPEQRFEASRFATIALQLTGNTRRRLYEEIEPTSGGEPRLQVIDLSADERMLRFIRLPARRVEVRGDFTGWEPVLLEAGPGSAWQKSFALPPGMHRVLVRIDGGEWQVPPDLPVERDEFGERVGVLFVPE